MLVTDGEGKYTMPIGVIIFLLLKASVWEYPVSKSTFAIRRVKA